jgi:hypothetical protein
MSSRWHHLTTASLPDAELAPPAEEATPKHSHRRENA